MERISRDILYTTIAMVVAQRSTCRRLKVGAVIVAKNSPVSIGYNGAPKGLPHCDEANCDPAGSKCLSTVHAEINAILFAARMGISIDGATLYCTHSPCDGCARAIINSGLTEVVYSKDYGLSGIALLMQAGISVKRGEMI